MVDLHSHIIYGVDDGARTLEDSLAMLRLAAESGTTDIVATPHANSTYPFDPPLLDSRYSELAQVHTGVPRIHRGSDFHLSTTNIRDAIEGPAKYTVNGGRYLMVELPEMFHNKAMDEVFWQFAARDVICIITHPERNPVLQRSGEILARWVGNGCLSQVTAMSLTGGFGPVARKAAWQFLHNGLVHFVASDAHDIRHRAPRLDAARSLMDREIGGELSSLLFEKHPRAVIENRSMSMDVMPVQQPKKWFKFW